jgi:hypothetical protein
MVNWTEKRVARLKLLHREGFSASVIAKKLGSAFSKAIVLRKLHVLDAAKQEAARLREARKKAKERQLQREARKAALAANIRRKTVATPSPKPGKPALLPGPIEIIRIPSPAPTLKPATGIRLFDLRVTHCRWPVGDDRPARLFCGAPTVGTTSWCEHHQRVVFGRSRSGAKSKEPATQWRIQR